MSGPERIASTCCIAGGGPAGMMLGFLLARAGVDVLVLEKHRDFLRDFRGDTIHPSTLELIHELGLLPELLALPHQKLQTIQAVFGQSALTLADFSHLPTQCGYIAFMPQWDFLDFLARHARRLPGLLAPHGMRGHGPHRRAAAGSPACARERRPATSRCARTSSSARTAGRPSCASGRGLRVRGPRRTDGRAVVPAGTRPRQARRATRPLRLGLHPDRHRPRRLLAMRLCHPERRA